MRWVRCTRPNWSSAFQKSDGFGNAVLGSDGNRRAPFAPRVRGSDERSASGSSRDTAKFGREETFGRRKSTKKLSDRGARYIRFIARSGPRTFLEMCPVRERWKGRSSCAPRNTSRMLRESVAEFPRVRRIAGGRARRRNFTSGALRPRAAEGTRRREPWKRAVSGTRGLRALRRSSALFLRCPAPACPSSRLRVRRARRVPRGFPR